LKKLYYEVCLISAFLSHNEIRYNLLLGGYIKFFGHI